MDKDPNKRFEPSENRRPRRLEEASTAEIGFPLVWIVVGGLAGLIVIGLIGLGVVNVMRQGGAITPTPQVLPPLVEVIETPTAVPVTTTPFAATAAITTTGQVTATNITPPPQGNTPEQPSTIKIGGYVKVIDTNGAGLNMRGGPGRNNPQVGLAEENSETFLEVIDGPHTDENAEDYVWWQIRHPDGTEGWVVQDYITPAQKP